MAQGIKAEIDETKLEMLAYLGANHEEVAQFFGVHRSTIHKRFRQIYSKGRQRGNAELRRLQWDSARKGNVAMLIWLGKQRLGQAEKADTAITSRDKIILEWPGVRDSK